MAWCLRSSSSSISSYIAVYIFRRPSPHLPKYVYRNLKIKVADSPERRRAITRRVGKECC